MRRHLASFSLLLGLLTASFVRSDENDPDLRADVQTLEEAKIGTDDPNLLAFIRQRTLSDTRREALAAAVRKLGDDDFEVREKASADLVKADSWARSLLRKAALDPDPEISRRARDCLEKIKSSLDQEETQAWAAVRVLAARRPVGTDRVLLEYLPSVTEPLLADLVVASLAKVVIRDGKPTTALRTALAATEPVRRAAAAEVIGCCSMDDRPAVMKLLTDPDGRVRLGAASGLARSGEKAAVPVLIALLTDGPEEAASKAEGLLTRLAGEQVPPVMLNPADKAKRQDCRAAWTAWWKANEGRIALRRIDLDEPLGLRVVCELQGAKGGGRVVAFGLDNKVRWQIDGPDVNGPIDFQLLPNGRVLIAEINSRRVTERDRTGKVFFEKKCDEAPMSCQRLPNGNTFIATYHEVLEVDAHGKTVYTHARPGEKIYCAQKLRNGNILTVDAGNLIIELTTAGKEVRRVPAGNTNNWGGVEIQPNANFLVACCGQYVVKEIDPTGKVLWSVTIDWPTWAGRLPNGRTGVACAQTGQVAEFDATGKQVWHMRLENRPCRLRRY